MSYNKETNLYEGYIYCVTNKINGKIYIGQTRRDIETRWKDHIYGFESRKINTYLYSAMRKYGVENFKISTIEKLQCLNYEDLIFKLNKAEVNYISLHNSMQPHGYNMVKGGACAGNTFEEKIVYQYDNMNNLVNTFISVNETSRQTGFDQADISNCCLKKKVKTVGNYIFTFENNDFSKKALIKTIFDMYSLNGDFIKRYLNYDDVYKDHHISELSNIRKSCESKNITAYGYIWRYPSESREIIHKINDFHINTTKQKTVYQYTKDLIFVNEFKSCKDAGTHLNLNSKKISAACTGRTKYYFDYIWSYIKFQDGIRCS